MRDEGNQSDLNKHQNHKKQSIVDSRADRTPTTSFAFDWSKSSAADTATIASDGRQSLNKVKKEIRNGDQFSTICPFTEYTQPPNQITNL